jgi:protein-S-isoprenylcysteine O-methyltransferase Ste14
MTRRNPLLVLPLLGAQILFVYLLSFAITSLTGVSEDLGLPWSLRLLGIPLAAFGIGMIAWTFRFRGWRAYFESTYVTTRKLLRSQRLTDLAGRTEPLVVAGPYRLVRHPFYSGFEAVTLGIAILVDHPWTYLGALVFWLWIILVVAPFEERELLTLFGTPYQEYMRTHRRFLPILRRPR